MNPLFVVPLLAYTLAATLWPGQVDGRPPPRPRLLIGEALFVIAALVLGELLAPLARPSGRWALVGAGGALGHGLPLRIGSGDRPDPRRTRAADAGKCGAMRTAPPARSMSPGARAVGSLERALALTMVLLGDYAAVGWIIAAKSLARFKQLEDREFAEYFLVGTLASFLLAVLVGVGIRILLKQA